MEKNLSEKVSSEATKWNESHADKHFSLPKVEHRTAAKFLEFMPYVSASSEIFTEDKFDCFIPSSDVCGVRYTCAFANPKNAEKIFARACNTEDLDKFEHYNNRLANELVYVLDMKVEDIL